MCGAGRRESASGRNRIATADFCPNWHVDRRADGAEVRDHHQVRSAGDVDDDYIFRRMSAIGYSRSLAKAATYGNRRYLQMANSGPLPQTEALPYTEIFSVD